MIADNLKAAQEAAFRLGSILLSTAPSAKLTISIYGHGQDNQILVGRSGGRINNGGASF